MLEEEEGEQEGEERGSSNTLSLICPSHESHLTLAKHL